MSCVKHVALVVGGGSVYGGTDTAAALDVYTSVLDERLQPKAILYLVGLLGGAQVEYKPVDLQSYEARNGL